MSRFSIEFRRDGNNITCVVMVALDRLQEATKCMQMLGLHNTFEKGYHRYSDKPVEEFYWTEVSDDSKWEELYSVFSSKVHKRIPKAWEESDLVVNKELWRTVVSQIAAGGSPYRLTKKDIPYLEGRLREAELGACGDRERTDIGRLHISAQESIRPESIKMLIDKINRLGGVYVMD